MGSLSRFDPVQPTILTVPRLGGSGPSHWQSLCEDARSDTVRVERGMWNTPHRNAGMTRLDQAIHSGGSPGDTRSIFAINAADAAQAHYLPG